MTENEKQQLAKKIFKELETFSDIRELKKFEKYKKIKAKFLQEGAKQE